MDERAQKLRVLWTKARNLYASFFCELDTVRKDIGDEKLSDWCFEELHISLSIIDNMSAVLRKGDAAQVRSDLAQAKKCEQEKRKAEAIARGAEVARIRRERAATDLEAARLEAEAQTIRTKEQAKEKVRKTWAAKSDEKKREENKKRYARFKAQKAREHNGPPVIVDLDYLAKQIIRGHELAVAGTINWIEGSIAVATALVQAKTAFPSTSAFSEWLTKNNLDFYSKDDRAALINLGSDAAAMREILSTTKSRCYDEIWRRAKTGYPTSGIPELDNVIPYPERSA